MFSGLFVASVYDDILYETDNFQDYAIGRFSRRAENASALIKNGHVIAIKTHEGWVSHNKFNPDAYDKIILVIRNIHNSLIAEFKRRHYKCIENDTMACDLQPKGK